MLFKYLLLAFWGLFFLTFYFLSFGIFNMVECIVVYGVYFVGLSLFNVIVNIVFVFVFRFGALGALWVGVISGVLGMLVVLVQVWLYYILVFDRQKFVVVFVVSLPILSYLFSGTMLKFVDRLFLIGKTTFFEIGVYSLVMIIASIAFVVLVGIVMVLNSLFYCCANQNDPMLLYDWVCLWLLFVVGVLVVGFGLAFIGLELIRLMTLFCYYVVVFFLLVLVFG